MVAAYGNGEEDVPTRLGVAFFRPASWERVIAAGDPEGLRDRDVDAVLRAFREVRDMEARGETRYGLLNSSLLDLQASMGLVRPDGSQEPLPPLASVLRGASDGSPVSRAFSGWLAGRHGPLCHGHSAEAGAGGPGDDGLRALLEGLRDLMSMRAGLRACGRLLVPSPSHGDLPNHKVVLGAALDAVDAVAGDALARFEDSGEPHEAEALEDVMARLDALRESIAARLEAARANGMAP